MRPACSESEYTFKHALTHEVATAASSRRAEGAACPHRHQPGALAGTGWPSRSNACAPCPAGRVGHSCDLLPAGRRRLRTAAFPRRWPPQHSRPSRTCPSRRHRGLAIELRLAWGRAHSWESIRDLPVARGRGSAGGDDGPAGRVLDSWPRYSANGRLRGAMTAARSPRLAAALGDSALQGKHLSPGLAYYAIGRLRPGPAAAAQRGGGGPESGTPRTDVRIVSQAVAGTDLERIGAFAEGRATGGGAGLATRRSRGTPIVPTLPRLAVPARRTLEAPSGCWTGPRPLVPPTPGVMVANDHGMLAMPMRSRTASRRASTDGGGDQRKFRTACISLLLAVAQRGLSSSGSVRRPGSARAGARPGPELKKRGSEARPTSLRVQAFRPPDVAQAKPTTGSHGPG